VRKSDEILYLELDDLELSRVIDIINRSARIIQLNSTSDNNNTVVVKVNKSKVNKFIEDIEYWSKICQREETA
jgi:hypothetical protein